MKNKLFIPLAFMLAISLTSAAQIESSSPIYSANPVSYKTPFTKIVVNDGIDIILTEQSQHKIWFDGKSKHLDKVEWEIKNGTLYLSSKAGSLKGRVKVNVNVQDLENLEVNGDSWVKSKGYLSSRMLDVLINGEALVDISNVGKISIMNSTDFNLDIMKRTKGVSVGGNTTR